MEPGIRLPRNEEEDVPLRCPNCDSNFTHHNTVEVFFREEDQQDVPGVSLKWDSNQSRTATSLLPQDENPSDRRDGIRLGFWCEECPNEAMSLCIVQHKGETFMYWECFEQESGTLPGTHASLPKRLRDRLAELSGHSEIHQTPHEVLVSNMFDRKAGSYKQILFLRYLCQRLEIAENDFVGMGIEEGRLHPARSNLLQWDNPLDQLTRSEIGGLFAFRELLESEES